MTLLRSASPSRAATRAPPRAPPAHRALVELLEHAKVADDAASTRSVGRREQRLRGLRRASSRRHRPTGVAGAGGGGGGRRRRSVQGARLINGAFGNAQRRHEAAASAPAADDDDGEAPETRIRHRAALSKLRSALSRGRRCAACLRAPFPEARRRGGARARRDVLATLGVAHDTSVALRPRCLVLLEPLLKPLARVELDVKTHFSAVVQKLRANGDAAAWPWALNRRRRRRRRRRSTQALLLLGAALTEVVSALIVCDRRHLQESRAAARPVGPAASATRTWRRHRVDDSVPSGRRVDGAGPRPSRRRAARARSRSPSTRSRSSEEEADVGRLYGRKSRPSSACFTSRSRRPAVVDRAVRSDNLRLQLADGELTALAQLAPLALAPPPSPRRVRRPPLRCEASVGTPAVLAASASAAAPDARCGRRPPRPRRRPPSSRRRRRRRGARRARRRKAARDADGRSSEPTTTAPAM